MKTRERRGIKTKLHRKQKGRCKYCNRSLELQAATFDHVVPKALGGANRVSNLVLACVECNRKKGSKPPHIWHAELMMGEVA